MKTDNLIIFVSGVICAGLLWQYYLYPKYTKKMQDPQTIQDLLEADRVAMDEELANIPGEVLYRSDITPQPSYENSSINYQEDPTLEKEKITMIKALAKYQVIKTQQEYQKVKDLLSLEDEKIDFSKEMLILVESAGNLNDGFFQIKNIEYSDQEIIVSYSFNIIGAKDRTDKISARKTKQSNLPIVLKQVL
ncbi:MAG: hypothetical protein II972_03885 [Elusimicrobiaceae bacterium]|nr:hypothetical protein [Elusimicrobiaceae bacterium]